MRREAILLLFTVLALTLIGLLMVFSASSVGRMAASTGSIYHYFLKQAAFAGIGFFVLSIMVRFDYHRLGDTFMCLLMLAVSLGLLVAALVPGIGVERNGARRWIEFGGLSFQPSEIAKVVLIIVVAAILARNQVNVKKFWKGFMPPMFVTGLFAGLVLLERDLGGPVTLCLVSFLMILAAGARLSHLALVMAPGVAGVYGLIVSDPERMQRLVSFRDPFSDPGDAGYQLIQSMAGFARGGLWGVGPGASEQKLWYLPEAHTDSIFAVWGEEMGLAGTLGLVFLFAMFLVLSLRIAVCARDMLGTLIAVGISTVIIFQAGYNMAMTIGLVPIKGLTLPFISAGGSSLVINLFMVGILLNIGLQAREPEEQGEAAPVY